MRYQRLFDKALTSGASMDFWGQSSTLTPKVQKSHLTLINICRLGHLFLGQMQFHGGFEEAE
jgi:hypothetical protein